MKKTLYFFHLKLLLAVTQTSHQNPPLSTLKDRSKQQTSFGLIRSGKHEVQGSREDSFSVQTS